MELLLLRLVQVTRAGLHRSAQRLRMHTGSFLQSVASMSRLFWYRLTAKHRDDQETADLKRAPGIRRNLLQAPPRMPKEGILDLLSGLFRRPLSIVMTNGNGRTPAESVGSFVVRLAPERMQQVIERRTKIDVATVTSAVKNLGTRSKNHGTGI